MKVNGYKIKPEADLRGANLHVANLSGANLSEADLSGANLRGANLRGAYLSEADLRRADLRWANLRWANLRGADLRGANLRWADLRGADLREANLSGATLPTFQVTPVGYPMVGFKKVSNGSIVALQVPPEAKRTASLVGRKCRAEYAFVLEGEGYSRHDVGKTFYRVGHTVFPDRYCDDIRVECAPGIHFFQTREEAENY